MKQQLPVEATQEEPKAQSLASVMTSPECLSASVLTICHGLEQSKIADMIQVLKQQTNAVHKGDMSRAETMLVAQAHTLDSLFAKLVTKALATSRIDEMESYMKLALKLQSQARATLQTLAEIKAPKQVAFVKQANIGNQVQVNNSVSSHARKTKKVPNELLEVNHGQQLDTRATSSTVRAYEAVEAVGKEHRTNKRTG